MERTSPVHYISPSNISIVPNANGSADDLAVYVNLGTTIKVCAPRAGIGTEDGGFQEWTLTGRNRRLANSDTPYTIYARLPKSDKGNGYIVFAPKVQYGDVWLDKYQYLVLDTPDGLADIEGVFIADGNWYVRLGDVSLPEDGKRTVTFDTGILGTELFNTEWALNPDSLPLRIELGCTINDEDAGPTPYVYWGQSLMLTAVLTEGWTGTDIKRFHHWEIMRNTGNASADEEWPSQERKEAFATSGSIELSHLRTTGHDDFNGAVSSIFTITAMGYPDDEDDSSSSGSSSSVETVPLKTISICIMAETVEKYEMAFSSHIVSFDPRSGSYLPGDGVKLHIRATDQRGKVFTLTNGQYQTIGLQASYAVVGSSAWTPLGFSGGSDAEAEATVPLSAFSAQQSVNVRLLNAANVELATDTIAFVRDGEDSKEREWIFLPSADAITFGTQEHPYPSDINGGEVDPSGAATGSDTDKDQDGWVPEGWYDEMLGTDETNRYEYGAYRDFIRDDDSSSSQDDAAGHWGEFSRPKIWSHYGKDGEDGKDGDDAIVAQLTPAQALIETSSAGDVTSEQSSLHLVEFYVGNTKQTQGFNSLQFFIDGTEIASSYHDEGSPRKFFKVIKDTLNNKLTGKFTLYVKDLIGFDSEVMEVTAGMTIDGKSVSRTIPLSIRALKQGTSGIPGADSVVAKADPENVIITQSTTEVSGVYPLVVVERWTVGNTPYEILGATQIKIADGGTEKTTGFTIGTPVPAKIPGTQTDCCSVVVNGTKVGIYDIGATSDGYVESGSVAIPITYNGKSYSVVYKFYCNLLGTWKVSVENGTERAIAQKLSHEIFGDDVHTIDQTGQYIRGWGENTSMLTKAVRTKNLIPSEGWTDEGGTLLSVENFDPDQQKLDSGGDDIIWSPVIFLAAGTYVFSCYTSDSDMELYVYSSVNNQSSAPAMESDLTVSLDNVVSGDTYKNLPRRYGTVTFDHDAYVILNLYDGESSFVAYRPQLEIGVTPTAWNIGLVVKSSVISQMAEQIYLSIINGLRTTGIFIEDGYIKLKADYINFYDSTGTNLNPKVFIEPTTGTLHAVGGSFEKIDVKDANITGSLVYHKQYVDRDDNSVSIYPFKLYDASGTVLSMDSQTPVASVMLDYDTIVISGHKRAIGYSVVLPPASWFPGVKIKIINATYSGGSGQAIVSDLSQINIGVFYRDADADVGRYDDDSFGCAKNLITSVLPVNFYKNRAFSLVGAPETNRDMTEFAAGNIYYVYGLLGDPNTLYHSFELISEKNPYAGDGNDYAWMIIDYMED